MLLIWTSLFDKELSNLETADHYWVFFLDKVLYTCNGFIWCNLVDIFTKQSQPCIKSCLKKLREKEEMLIISIFSFAHTVFHPFKEFKFIMPHTNALNLDHSKFLYLGKVI